MTKKGNTKKALLMSALSLLLCVSMLVGTTFAWFTDEVKSGTNIIAAGNLDVELTHTDKAATDEKVDGNIILFDDVKLWEPGAVAYEKLTVSNVGSLALKYNLAINIAKASGVLVNNKVYTLADVLKVAVVDANELDSRENAIKAGEGKWKPLTSWFENGNLYPEEGRNTDTYGIVIYWEPSENDNIFNMNNGKTTTDGGKQLTIELGVHLVATQLVHENDSYGDDYDKDAFWTGDKDTDWYSNTETEFMINTAEELAGLAQLVNSGTDTFVGKTVKLGANIDLNDVAWTPIGSGDDGWNSKFNGSFYGNGYTISNLYVVGTTGLGLFGYVGNAAHIEGVTIDGAYVSGNDYVGAVVGTGYLASDCLKNCTVKNAEIYATPYLTTGGIYDGGAKAGAVAGFVSNGKVIGNKAENCIVSAYRDLGGIVGMVQGENYTVDVSGNSVDGITLKYFDLNGAAYDGDKVNENMGSIVGRQSNVSLGENTEKNVTRKTVIYYTDDDIKYEKDVDTGVVTLIGFTENYTGENLKVPEGVNALGNKVLNGNTTIKEVILPTDLTNFGGTANADGKGATGGFFYKSAVEKIILPEDMTEIPVAAFNQATNLKEVNIPSTVTTIGINAFAGTGLTELTVPSTVTSIGYGAFRDMANLTTVTIEGDVNLPGYAFRSCTNLKTVYITGEKVTFDKGQIFTNYDTGVASNITVYVANETVKERLLAANTATGYSVVVMDIVDAEDEEQDFTTILKNAKDGDVIYLTAGEYAVNNYNVGNVKNLTIIGESSATISVATDTWSGSWKPVFGINFDNLTLRNLVISDILFSGKVTFDNCTFTNGFTGSEGNLDFTITNCTMNGRLQFSNSGTSKISVSGVTVTEAEFYSKGGVEFTDCTIEGAMIPWDTNTVLTNCTVGDYNFEHNGENTLIVDGTYYAGNAKMLKAAVAAGATTINLFDGEYDVYGCGGKTLTINGSKNAVLKIMNEGEDGCDYGFDNSKVTFNGITIDTSANTGNYKGYARLTATFNNCDINGAYTTHIVQNFNNCTFNTNNGYIWIWGADKVTFNGCAFVGNSKAILAHGWASTVININNCHFNATEKGYTGSGDNTAAIEIDPAGTNIYTINFTGENTITESYAGLTRVKDGSTGHVITTPTEVNSATDLTDALNKGKNVELTKDVTAPLSGSAIYGTPVAAVQYNGGVIDGKGNSLDIENPQYNGYAIETWGGTIQNLVIDSTVGRGIVISLPNEDIYIDNVVIDGPGYAINTTEHSAKKLIVTKSTIKGWTSLAGLELISFTDCIFGENTAKYWQNMGYDQDYDRLIRPYVDATFTNCEFEQGFYIDLSTLGEDCMVTLTDCFCGDVEITAVNYTQFITIELPSGRTLSDCVIFN